MKRTPGELTVALAVICLTAVGLVAAHAGYKDEIGLTALQAELGTNAPTGAGVTVSQIEGQDMADNYAPDSTHPELVGKTINLKSGASGASGHATSVARNWYGTSTGTAPGVSTNDAYEAGHYIGAGFLRTGNNLAAPVVEIRRIQNHAWVANTSSAQEAIRRLDFAIKRDGFVAVVGLNNFSTTEVPDLLAHSYNAISVGVSTGDHSRGGTRFDTAGRLKPEIVSPSAFGGVSHSVAVISGAAALLLEVADKNAGLALARTNSEIIKAILMAGATKHEFPTWTRTSMQPLDLVYGAGEVNVYNSYHIFVAGKQAASTSSTVSTRGWDFATTASGSARYFFDVATGFVLTNLSVLLNWNRDVYDSAPGPTFSFDVTLANLALRLYAASGFTLGALLESSVSALDNVEHISVDQLFAGRYALEVTWDLTGHDYAIAWDSSLIELPPPQLSVTRSNSAVMVSWPLSASGYVLQTTTNLNAPIVWTDIPPSYQTNATGFFFSVPAPGGPGYFQLAKPQ